MRRSTIGQVITLKKELKKRSELNFDVRKIFVDLKPANGSINRGILFKIKLELGIPEKLAQLFNSIE